MSTTIWALPMALTNLPLQTTTATVAEGRFGIVPSSRSSVRSFINLAGTRSRRRASLLVVDAAGGGLAEPPTIKLPGLGISKDTRRQQPRNYRVMLHNDNFNRREYVVQVLLKIINGLTVDDAVNVMQEAHQNGLACAVVSVQEEAEQYCEGLRNNGLISSIEPCGGGGREDGPVA
eukprot:jgi/Botrbrau1/6665/Bobra.0202s0013.1